MTREVREIRRKRREYAKKARRRLILARMSILCLAAVSVAIISINALTTAFARDNHTSFDIITVKSGDTLWSIATDYNDGNKDIRTVIDKIMRANDMKTTNICVGDKLSIPLS